MKYLLIAVLSILSSLRGFGQDIDVLLAKADSGSVSAQIELAKCYIEGNGVEQSQSGALKWFEKAAQKNNVEAMVACGELLCDKWNIDLEPDYVQGLAWYRKAASKGDTKAKEFLSDFNSSIAYEVVADGCPYNLLPCDDDLKRCAFLKENQNIISAGVSDNNPIATYYLAVIAYDNTDFSSAVKYLSDIYPLVMNEDLYYEDIFDQEENSWPVGPTIAVKVFSLLGWCYEHGQGVDTDYVKAAEYYLSEFDYAAFGMTTIPKVRGAYCLKKANLTDKFIKEATTQCIETFGDATISPYYVPCLQLELAGMYMSGEGVLQNKKKALEIYESIVDRRTGLMDFAGWYPEIRSYSDIGEAAYRAYRMYLDGEGCKPDEEMAELYFEVALKYGNHSAWYEHQNK